MSTYLLNIYLASLMSVTWLASSACSSDAPSGDRRARQTVQQTESNIVETPPMAEPELANQPQGQSPPGRGESVPRDGGKQAPGSDQPSPPQGWTTYFDRTHGFSIGHPKGFIVQPNDVSKFTPAPVATIFFMSPTMAKGALAGVEPPDLELRIYKAGAASSLKTWLTAVGFLNDGTTSQSYRNANVSGLKVCQLTLIAPGCSVYVLHDGRVHQLTPSSQEGEAMLETFVLSTRR